ncbi:MAG: hypothetical protein Q4C77_14410 [Eubacteriales bacterium]|nr:hypothetical protein [Eubacteriales bacterium]
MAGYQRFVAYVYEYLKGKKGNNCGFIKVEVREQQCRLELHLQCPGLPAQAECKIYGFVRSGGLMDGNLLGTCETGEGTAQCFIETDALNMNGTGVALGKMGGLILTTEGGAFFGTEWDDFPIRPENFREVKSVFKESPTVRHSGKKYDEEQKEGLQSGEQMKEENTEKGRGMQEEDAEKSRGIQEEDAE